MKNKLRFLGFYIAILAIITLTLSSCDIMKPTNEPGDTPTGTPGGPSGTYTGSINDATYILTVYPAASKAAHAAGDDFTLIVRRNNTEKTSSGKLVGVNGGTFSAQPSYRDAVVFTITISGSQIIDISADNITFNDGSTEKGPGPFSSGGDGGDPTFTPANVAVTGVTLSPTTLDLTVGGPTGTLTATVAPDDATNKTITWSTSDGSVATVNNGVVTAVGSGTATITASTQDGGKTATCAVTVNPFTVTFNSVTANGSTNQTTTQLTLTFDKAITGLSADNITLSGVSGVSKGTLSGSGPTYTLPISGFSTGGTLSVAVSDPSGNNISGSPKTVTIFAARQTISEDKFEYYWVNEHGILVTTSGNAVTIAAGATLIITAQSPGYVVRQWHLNGKDTGQSGDTYSFSSTTPGKHTVGLFVEKDGKLYNANITITVLGLRSITIDMYDSRGDGWDGNGALRINVNGVDIATNIKVQTDTNKYNFNVIPGDVVRLYWVAGTFQEENSFIAYYTNTPPSPAFSPNTAWNGSNALVYRLRNTMNSISGGTLLGSFTVQ